MAARKLGVPFCACSGRDQEKNISRFLHGHLILLAYFAATILLSVGQRIDAQIVRSKGKRPARHFSVAKHRFQLRFNEPWVEEQKHRSRRIDYVYGRD